MRILGLVIYFLALFYGVEPVMETWTIFAHEHQFIQDIIFQIKRGISS
ncbi:hypothetical protein LYSBPC_22940 [Lysinibacillus piscis]|uniref:Uncharacterized protein n=1 Tax=Lysinibacillus piscis TaxID=2518931 RepID=A0ABQ5NM34_9BACI|nr:hypothetical protein LYSBPC_22940 [Lysinibacillus sp. KH24]